MGNRAAIIFLNETQTKEYIENRKYFALKAGSNYIYTHWNGGVESICAFVDFARFLKMNELEIEKKYIEFYAMLRNFFFGFDSYYKYGIFGEYGNRYGNIKLETLDYDTNVNGVLFFNNKPCVISDAFEIISYTSEEIDDARKDEKYQEIFNGLKKQYAKIETKICESVIDGRKLAEQLECSDAYEWFIKDNNGSYTQDKFDLGIVLANNLNYMSKEHDMLEYTEEMTREKTDAVCKMLDAMFEFCEKRQIKYINLN